MKIFVDNGVILDVLLERKDFEDAVQYYTALKQKVAYIVTRNKKGYINTKIPVVTPQKMCAILKLA